MNEPPRVLVTGVGAITPVGLTAEVSWQAMLRGESGIDTIEQFDASSFPVKVAGEVKHFEPGDFMDRRTVRRTARFSQFGMVAAQEAAAMARLPEDPRFRDRTGVVIATGGGLHASGEQQRRIEEHGPKRVDPLFVTKTGSHMAAARIGRALNLRGPNTTVNSACASGSDAIGQAVNLLRLGYADAVLAGGAEAIVHPVTVSSMGIIGALSSATGQPQTISRPFDRERTGFVLGEGAGLLMLETEEAALKRDAPVLAELAGVGWSFDAADDTAPDVGGQALAMQRALDDAGMSPKGIDYIKAHGTSTPLNDKTETAAVKKVFGQHAYDLAMSAPKSMIGHAACAAGGVESVIAVLSLRDQQVVPTINYEHPDPDCDLDYVPNESRKMSVDAVLANAFGMGGQNACLVFKRYEP